MCVGGKPSRAKDEEEMILSTAVHIFVGTPGSVLHMIHRNLLQPCHIKVLVLGKARGLLLGHCKREISEILDCMPSKIQLGVFSDAMPPKALNMIRRFLNKPVRVVYKPEPSLEGIQQFCLDVGKDEWKLEAFLDLFEHYGIYTQNQNCVIIYLNNSDRVKWVHAQLCRKGYHVYPAYWNMSESDRDATRKGFNSGSILVSTDLPTPCVDARQVSFIINWDLPAESAKYVSRVGHRGQFGKKAFAINFITCNPDDRGIISAIKSDCDVIIQELPSFVPDMC